MKVTKTQTDRDTVTLSIIATGDTGDNLELPQMGGPTDAVPYSGPYTIQWGDGSPLEVVPQAAGEAATQAVHNYTQKGSFRGYVEGDARIRFWALSS